MGHVRAFLPSVLWAYSCRGGHACNLGPALPRATLSIAILHPSPQARLAGAARDAWERAGVGERLGMLSAAQLTLTAVSAMHGTTIARRLHGHDVVLPKLHCHAPHRPPIA